MSKIRKSTPAALSDVPLSILNVKAAVLVYSGIEGIALIDEISEFFGEDSDQFITRLGLFYFTAIGQGGDYHQGFYGPLPIPNDKEHVSFIFSTLVADEAQLDERAGGLSYVMVCLICQKSHLPKIIDWLTIETTFRELFATLEDIREIVPQEESFVNSLKLSLIEGSSSRL
ncbi:MAG: hypothetical protein ACE5OZ_17865 [Candidatus Heimdallarchaeota archaeon]